MVSMHPSIQCQVDTTSITKNYTSDNIKYPDDIAQLDDELDEQDSLFPDITILFNNTSYPLFSTTAALVPDDYIPFSFDLDEEDLPSNVLLNSPLYYLVRELKHVLNIKSELYDVSIQIPQLDLYAMHQDLPILNRLTLPTLIEFHQARHFQSVGSDTASALPSLEIILIQHPTSLKHQLSLLEQICTEGGLDSNPIVLDSDDDNLGDEYENNTLALSTPIQPVSKDSHFQKNAAEIDIKDDLLILGDHSLHSDGNLEHTASSVFTISTPGRNHTNTVVDQTTEDENDNNDCIEQDNPKTQIEQTLSLNDNHSACLVTQISDPTVEAFISTPHQPLSADSSNPISTTECDTTQVLPTDSDLVIQPVGIDDHASEDVLADASMIDPEILDAFDSEVVNDEMYAEDIDNDETYTEDIGNDETYAEDIGNDETYAEDTGNDEHIDADGSIAFTTFVSDNTLQDVDSTVLENTEAHFEDGFVAEEFEYTVQGDESTDQYSSNINDDTIDAVDSTLIIDLDVAKVDDHQGDEGTDQVFDDPLVEVELDNMDALMDDMEYTEEIDPHVDENDVALDVDTDHQSLQNTDQAKDSADAHILLEKATADAIHDTALDAVCIDPTNSNLDSEVDDLNADKFSLGSKRELEQEHDDAAAKRARV
ncbi:hypothetical protein RTP6_006595 [Batrachochytrium dendrobatidis]